MNIMKEDTVLLCYILQKNRHTTITNDVSNKTDDSIQREERERKQTKRERERVFGGMAAFVVKYSCRTFEKSFLICVASIGKNIHTAEI